jgi:L-ascorbate metabolism protein UlaG (beta-lactamase superfamily)
MHNKVDNRRRELAGPSARAVLCALLLFFAAGVLPAQVRRPSDEFPTSAFAVTVTAIHHASMMLQANEKAIYVDPWSQGNYDGLPQADLILITDVHPDHLDKAMVDRLSKPGTVIIAPEAVSKTITRAKVLHNGEHTTWGVWEIDAIPMYNLKRGPSEGKLYHDKGRGNGYVLTFGGVRFYIAGDTEGIPEMRALKNIDVAFVPMNLPYTMTPEEAADAVRAFHPRIVYPYHYQGSNIKDFARLLNGSGIDVRLRDWYY